MARQFIINYCHYDLKSYEDINFQKKCPDFKYDKNKGQCKYLSNDVMNPTCSCENPTELFGYNLTNQDIELMKNGKDNE